jgi:hypothetical protein
MCSNKHSKVVRILFEYFFKNGFYLRGDELLTNKQDLRLWSVFHGSTTQTELRTLSVYFYVTNNKHDIIPNLWC